MTPTPATAPAPTAVPLTEAIAWTANWRDASLRMRAKARAFSFAPDEIAAVIHQPGTVRVRFYLGLAIDNKDGSIVEKMICVGVDKDGKDMIPRLNNGQVSDDTGEIYDFAHPCPDACDSTSPLN